MHVVHPSSCKHGLSVHFRTLAKTSEKRIVHGNAMLFLVPDKSATHIYANALKLTSFW